MQHSGLPQRATQRERTLMSIVWGIAIVSTAGRLGFSEVILQRSRSCFGLSW